jgi:hypothetical protein
MFMSDLSDAGQRRRPPLRAPLRDPLLRDALLLRLCCPRALEAR